MIARFISATVVIALKIISKRIGVCVSVILVLLHHYLPCLCGLSSMSPWGHWGAGGVGTVYIRQCVITTVITRAAATAVVVVTVTQSRIPYERYCVR